MERDYRNVSSPHGGQKKRRLGREVIVKKEFLRLQSHDRLGMLALLLIVLCLLAAKKDKPDQ